jgi:xanthine dehydrogenase iron-sulfur cluster and FAD-binding subunit A
VTSWRPLVAEALQYWIERWGWAKEWENESREEREMIPAPFEYHRPRSLDEAIGLLAQHGEDARVVAGGHSLIPMMKLRLAKPEHLVDLQDLDELRGIRSEPDAVVIGRWPPSTN